LNPAQSSGLRAFWSRDHCQDRIFAMARAFDQSAGDMNAALLAFGAVKARPQPLTLLVGYGS
jgi:hypothetical protein